MRMGPAQERSEHPPGACSLVLRFRLLEQRDELWSALRERLVGAQESQSGGGGHRARMQGQRAQVSAHERGSGSLDAGLAEQERAAIDADGAVAPLQELAQVAPVAASQIHDRFARLDSGEAQRSDDVLAGELP